MTEICVNKVNIQNQYTTGRLRSNYQLHVSAIAAVAIIRLDTIYQRSYIDMIRHRTIIADRGRVAQRLRCCVTNRKVAGSIPAGVSGFFFDIKSFRSHFDPVVDSASTRNEYHEYFLGGKDGRCVRLTTYHDPVPLSRNLGTLTSWNPLGLSRPVMGLLYLYLTEQLFGIRVGKGARSCLHEIGGRVCRW